MGTDVVVKIVENVIIIISLPRRIRYPMSVIAVAVSFDIVKSRSLVVGVNVVRMKRNRDALSRTPSSRERVMTHSVLPSLRSTSNLNIIMILNVKRANIVTNGNENSNLAMRHLGYFDDVMIGAAALGAVLTPRKRGP